MLNRIGKKLGYKEGGFTIIEVMIVLAVAGLIMAIVLVAIPQLQRSQRNSARRDVTNRIKTEIDSYSGNNNGRIPQDLPELNELYTRYLGCPTGATQYSANEECDVNINGASTGIKTPTIIGVDDKDGSAPAALLWSIPGGPQNLDTDFIVYQPEATCNGEGIEDAAGNLRVYAMWMQLEGGAIYCVDNR